VKITLLERPREVVSHWHVKQVVRLLAFDSGRCLDTVLVYAAVELRAAIERTLLELLFLVKELQLTDDEMRRARSRQGVDAMLQEADTAYRKTVEFTRLAAEVTPGVPPITAVDTAYLRRRWQDLSEYCHAQTEPAKTFESPNRTFQRDGFRIVREVVEHFLRMYQRGYVGLLARSSMPAETRAIYDRFIANEIDADQAKRMLAIAEPVLRRRLGPRS
jgi:hypothetical protein